MKSELIIIEDSKELQVLTSVSSVDSLIADVQDRVNNLDGGTMDTGIGRKKIISNANKAKKSKTALYAVIDGHIENLKDTINSKTLVEQQTISKLKDSKIQLGDGLDNIYTVTRQKVTDFETELKRIKAESDKKAEDEKQAAQLESDHEVGLLMNEKFDRDLADQKAEEDLQRLESIRIAREEQEKREEAIRVKAAEDAQLKAEQEAANKIAEEKAKVIAAKAAEAKAKQDVIDAKKREEAQRQAAIQAELEAEQAEERRVAQEAETKRQAEIAEQQRIDREKQLKIELEHRAKQEEIRRVEQNRINEAARVEACRQAEIRSSEAAEQARLNEVARQNAEAQKVSDDQAKREANKSHIGKVRKQAKESLMTIGLTEDAAKSVVLALSKGQIANCKINY